MKLSHILVLIGLMSLTACKTQEDIQREKMITQVNEKIDTSLHSTQKQVAESSSRLDSFDERLNRINGQLEEISHKTSQSNNDQIQKIMGDLGVLKEESKNNKVLIEDLRNKFDTQKNYLDQVLKTLAELTDKTEKSDKEEKAPVAKPAAKKKDKKNDAIEEQKPEKVVTSPTIENAIHLLKSKNFDDARVILHDLSESKKTPNKIMAQSLFLLGGLEFEEKREDAALVYYSRVATEFTKSDFAPQSFLMLAKIFEKQKKYDQAKMSLEEFLNRFPKNPKVKEVKKYLAKLGDK